MLRGRVLTQLSFNLKKWKAVINWQTNVGPYPGPSVSLWSSLMCYIDCNREPSNQNHGEINSWHCLWSRSCFSVHIWSKLPCAETVRPFAEKKSRLAAIRRTVGIKWRRQTEIKEESTETGEGEEGLFNEGIQIDWKQFRGCLYSKIESCCCPVSLPPCSDRSVPPSPWGACQVAGPPSCVHSPHVHVG